MPPPTLNSEEPIKSERSIPSCISTQKLLVATPGTMKNRKKRKSSVKPELTYRIGAAFAIPILSVLE